MKITMPDWHEDARRLRDEGHSLGRIVLFLKDAGINVSESRVSQVTNSNWQDYNDKDRVRQRAYTKEIAAAKKEGRLPDIKKASKEAIAQWEKDKSMSDRAFEMVTAADPTDVYHRVRIKCSHEGCGTSLIFARRGLINPVQASRWFRDKGWSVGNGPRMDLCPAHNTHHGNGHEHKPEPKPVPKADGGLDIQTKHTEINDIPVHADSTIPGPAQKELVALMHGEVPKLVPTMSRADKRIVFNKLEEVYVDEFIGYKSGWDDEKVSTDLGCPIEWVAAVRDENFGPVMTETRKMSDLIRLGEEIKVEVNDLQVHATGIRTAIVQYDKLVEDMDKRLDDYEGKQSALTARLLEFTTKMKEIKNDG